MLEPSAPGDQDQARVIEGVSELVRFTTALKSASPRYSVVKLRRRRSVVALSRAAANPPMDLPHPNGSSFALLLAVNCDRYRARSSAAREAGENADVI